MHKLHASLLLWYLVTSLGATGVTTRADWACGPCRQALAEGCQMETTPTGCGICVSRHQHTLKAAGCTHGAALGWCSTAGRAQVCFDDGSCASLARVASTSSQRASLNATCDPSSPLHFNWGPPEAICSFNWVEYVQSDPRTVAMAQIPGLATEYWADMQALLMQSSWYQDSEKDVPALLAAGQLLPANYRIPMLLISSGLNRLRDLDDSSLQLLHSITGNSGPSAWNTSTPSDLDTAPARSVIAFSGVDGQTGGTQHPLLPYCNRNSNSSQHVINITNHDYASFSLSRDHALTYAGGASPSLLVWEMDTAGNQPYSGEWELIPSPMATFRQIACDLAAPGGTDKLGMSAISYAYETTTRGVQSVQVEAQILQGLRSAVDDQDSLQPPAGLTTSENVASSANFNASVRQATDDRKVWLGDAVTIDVDSSAFVPTPTGTVVWPFVNGTQFGAFVTCAVLQTHGNHSNDNCSLMLPLPYAGDSMIELAVFPEGRDWGGKDGAWAVGQRGPCNQTAGCVYPVGQVGPGPNASLISPPLHVYVRYRRISLPSDVDPDRHQVCINYEPWFTKLNIARWEGRAGASGVPLVGFYSSSHPMVIRQHSIWLTEAGVTCINLDFTNMLWNKIQWSSRGPNVDEIINATTAMLREYARLRDEGHDSPRVMMSVGLTNMLPSALRNLALYIRDNFHRRFGEQHFVRLDGVPVLPVLYLGDIAPFSVPFPTPEVTDIISANHSFAVRYMGVSLDRNMSLGKHFGFWSWMDSSSSPVPAMRDGVVEALTVTNAFFKSGQRGGWLGAGAIPQRRGQTFVSEMQHARQLQPRILLVTQWNEWTGAPDGNQNAYTDDYNLTLSNEFEPVSLTECGGYVHQNDEGQLPLCNTGYGFRNLNILAGTLQAYRDAPQTTRTPRQTTTILCMAPVVLKRGPGGFKLAVAWSVVGPRGAVKLTVDDKIVLTASNRSNVSLDVNSLQLRPGLHQICAEAVSGWSRFQLAKDKRDKEQALHEAQHPVDCVSFDINT